jgi:type IV secretory pathway VirB10-like protein
MSVVEELKEKPQVPEEGKSVPFMDDGAVLPQRKFFVSKRATDLGEKNSKTVLWTGIAVAAVAVVGIFSMSHREIPGMKHQPTPVKQTQAVQRKPTGDDIPSDKPKATAASSTTDGISATDIENTKNHSSNPLALGATNSAMSHAGVAHAGRNTAGKPLSSVPAFQPPPYQRSGAPVEVGLNNAESTTQLRALADEVTKPSLIFTAQAVKGGQGQGQTSAAPITNFGVEPGFHVTSYLESAISTFGNIPVVAIIEYNYMREGKILIPAGSRVVGKVTGGNATGTVTVDFSEIYLPDGSRVPIKAIGLDTTLRPLKGKVTGKHTGKTFLLASLTSVGTLGAGFLGSGNSSAVTQQSLARDQISSNIGRAGDQAIQQMEVSQQIVITIPAGTVVEVTFTSPEHIGANGGTSADAGGR